jgi:formylglycine-generating enzyme required for sulfatase activity
LNLPTEAQWEYACRAGTVTARYQEDVNAIAWYDENSNHETHDVGQKQPNAWGLYDMLGNVLEWCQDGWHEYTGTAAVDPIGSAEPGVRRVFRGGGWDLSARFVRSAFRIAVEPAGRDDALGFRCSSSE